MNKITEIINQIVNTSSTNGKLKILVNNKDNELLKKVMKYTYDENLKFGITEEVINPFIKDVGYNVSNEEIFLLLDELAHTNINDSLRVETGKILGSLDSETRSLVIKILTKDLRCGVSTKTIQKVWGDVIPKWGCMLASKYFDCEKLVKGKSFTLTNKLDGHRCLVLKQGEIVTAYSRQHKEYLGLEEILEEVKQIEGDVVLDGELLVSNYKEISPETRYKATSNIVRKDGIKTGVSLVVFDILPLTHFNEGKSNMQYSIRRALLESVILGFKHLEVVEKFYQGEDTNVILPLLEEVTEKGEEGLMLSIDNSPYECKRTKGLLKLKKFQTADLKVLAIEEGNGKNKGKLGAITIQFEHNGSLHTCNVGTGFSDEERILYYNNQELLINKIVEIDYFEITSNAKGEFGLRFPSWKSRIRHDKTEISMF